MKVLEGWELNTMIDSILEVIINTSLGLLSAVLLIRILSETSRGWFANQYRYHIPSFLGILITLAGILCYQEVTYLISDAFYDIATALRGSSEQEFKSTKIWDAIQEKYGTPEEDASIFDIAQNYLKDAVLNPVGFGWDMLQNWWGLATIMTWQGLGLLFRAGMIIFKNIMLVFMIFAGPIPLVMSLFPSLSGFAAHWLKNFIVVCYWNITIAILDVIISGINYQMLSDFAFGGDEEMTLGMLTMFTAICYLFVPYMTSLAIGQTIVAMAGSKLVMTPLATMAAAGRLGAGAGASPVKPSIPKPAQEKPSSAPVATKSPPNATDVRTIYSATPVPRRSPGIGTSQASVQRGLSSGGSHQTHYGSVHHQSSGQRTYHQSSHQSPTPKSLPPKGNPSLPERPQPKFLLQQNN